MQRKMGKKKSTSKNPSGSTTNTHIYPLQVTVRNRGGYNSVIGVNDRNDIHPKQLVQGAAQVAALLLIMKIQIGD